MLTRLFIQAKRRLDLSDPRRRTDAGGRQQRDYSTLHGCKGREKREGAQQAAPLRRRKLLTS